LPTNCLSELKTEELEPWEGKVYSLSCKLALKLEQSVKIVKIAPK
jgi:hypothetical protein